MPVEHDPVAPSPDEFDRQLRDLASGQAGTAKFREPSAAERASRAAARPSQSQDSGQAGTSRAGRIWRIWRGFGRKGAATAHRPRAGSRRQRIRSAAKPAGILVGFIALLVVLHLLGYGPQ